MPNRELILEMNSEQVNLARTGVSDASDVATIQVAGDTTPPAAVSGESATQIPLGIKIEWLCPSTNSDGTTCVDLRWSKIYYKSTTGVTTSSYDGTYVIASRAGENAAFSDTVAVGTARYYIITALDNSGNESTASGEVDSTGGGSGPTTNIPDNAAGVVFDDSYQTEGVGAGDGIIGIIFKVPPGTWSEFDHYRLWYDTNTGGGFSGSWTEIKPINRTAYQHKGLNTSYLYKYKAYIVAEDGTESTDPDYATNNGNTGDGGPGYQPNQTNNSIFDGTVLVGNLVAVNEVRGEHFFAESFLAINDTTWQNQGIQLEYNTGTPRAYIGNGDRDPVADERFIMYDGTNLSWRGENTYLTAAGEFGATNATITGIITADTGYIGGTNGWVIAAGKLTASGIGMATTTGDATYAFWAGNDSPASAEFSVTHAGVLSATGATITNTTISGTSTWTGSTIGTAYTTADVTGDNTAAAIAGQGDLATEDDLDGVPNGSTYGRIANTYITAGRISLLGGSNVVTVSTSGLDVGSSGHIQGGATAYMTGTGFYLGYSSGYKFRIGSTTEYMRWTGSNVEVAGGTIIGSSIGTAASGTRCYMAPSYGGNTHGVWLFDNNYLRAALLNDNLSFFTSSNVSSLQLGDAGGYGEILLYSAGSIIMTIQGDSTPSITTANATSLTIDADTDLTLTADRTTYITGISTNVDITAGNDIILDAAGDIKLEPSGDLYYTGSITTAACNFNTYKIQVNVNGTNRYIKLWDTA